ncbi:tRNA (adenosine(37)-N6)-dimethylallyltransferase MiaA [Sphingorhabdus lutea]|uniref:tRNA dimethylallyltransferase n=1 Tax=Sphingorhabdus lutea TaxID=1913578 RepID=A0A1L3JCQ8_9SPHN|nr:tRNA (adenosine(37)-N6)-dimethylallyltransferase MiaA [Sphingorhabdus lutea]APG62914.1 tRNA (adenosine(37)-N6)-dimethylallyltransferase MiaA [Sphingorhabdus lutea]
MSNPENKNKQPLLLIAGPTASGKTASALQLAKTHKISIINADSAQVYDGMPILSAQPSREEMASAPHHLFGYLPPYEYCSAARWANDAKRELQKIWDKDRLPILVGGTGLYMRTLLDGISPVPAIDANVRHMVRQLDVTAAYAQLCHEDPIRAKQLNPNDDARIKRSLEVVLSTQRSLLSWQQEKSGGILENVDLEAHILLPDRNWLYERCDRRFDQMIDLGAIDEVKMLISHKLPHDAPAARAIGVKEISAFLAQEINKEEMLNLGKIATRQYAKRQFTWFRNQSPPSWNRVELNSKLSFNNEIISKFEI